MIAAYGVQLGGSELGAAVFGVFGKKLKEMLIGAVELVQFGQQFDQSQANRRRIVFAESDGFFEELRRVFRFGKQHAVALIVSPAWLLRVQLNSLRKSSRGLLIEFVCQAYAT